MSDLVINPKTVTWLVYKRLRVSLGTFALVACYGAYAGILGVRLLLAATGLALVELFGAAYNDYTDYDEDVRNVRTEKLTVSGLLQPDSVRTLAFTALVIGLAIELTVDVRLFALSAFYGTLLFLYSYPRVFLKQYNIAGYLAVESFWLLMPFGANLVAGAPRGSAALFAGFGFFQCVYFLCQKDSTDKHDRTNLFLALGWRWGSLVATATALLASTFLLLLVRQSGTAPSLLGIWFVNLIDKTVNCTLIWQERIDRRVRGRLILFEFLTPLLCALVWAAP